MIGIDSHVFETGGELVASQSATGYVHFIVHPRHSDRLRPKNSELILFRPFDPAEVTPQLVRKVLRSYLLILQDSFAIGIEDALTLRERCVVVWLYFRELRNRHEIYRSMISLRNEWTKAAIAGVIAFLIGYITGSGKP